MPLYKAVGYNFLPDEDESAFQVSLRAPQGTSLAATQSVMERIARDVREQLPGISSTLTVAGFARRTRRAAASGLWEVALISRSRRKPAA